jgi:hypothetical protein
MSEGYPRFAVAGVLVLVLLGAVWAFGGFDGLSVAGGLAVVFGIVVVAALGTVLMTVVMRGRRSRRDEVVHRRTGRGG